MKAFISSIIHSKSKSYMAVRSHPVFFLVLCLLFLSGCSSSGLSNSNLSSQAPAPYKDIFAQLEQGNYRDAEDIIQNKVLGNVKEEANAVTECANFAELLIDAYNNEKLPLENVETFIDAAAQTSFDSYFQQANLHPTVYQLAESKEHYATGVELLEQDDPDYLSAASAFLSVWVKDSNFTDTVRNLNMILENLISDGQLNSLKMASDIGESLSWKLGFFTDAFSDFDDQNNMRDSWIQAQFLYAQALEANYRYAHAIRQYSRIKNVCKDARDRFATLQRTRNAFCDTVGIGFYSIDPNGYVSLVRPPDYGIWWAFQNRSLDALQITGQSDVYASSGYIAILDSDGNLSITTNTNCNDATFNALPDSIPNVIKAIATYNKSLIVLGDSGDFSVYGQIDSAEREIMSWHNLIDFWYYNNQYIGLTDSGQVLTTDSNIVAALESWYDIVSVAKYSVGLAWHGYIGLKSDGNVYCIDNYGNAVSLNVPEIIAVAGNHLLCATGDLLELSQGLSASTIDSSGNVVALFPSNYYGGYSFALCTDGQYLIEHSEYRT